MLQTDFQRFRAVMTGMAKLYEREIDAALLDAYWISLREWPLEEFERAAGELMRTSEFMPRPAAFHALRKAQRPCAAEAWGLPAGIDPIADRALLIATQGRYIGHIALDELTWVQKRFMEVYDELTEVLETRLALGSPTGEPLLPGPRSPGLVKL